MKPHDVSEFILGSVEVPESALKMGAVLLVDTLSVAAGATSMDAGRIARDHAVRFLSATRPEDAAPLLFDGRMCSIPGASFAAATQIDNLDAHDGYNPTKGHIGCAVVPALCAFAEHMPDLTGREALITLVIAYEIAARAAIALHETVDDYHTSGAWNALGVAALGCRLRGHDPTRLRQALGIAEYHGPRSQMMREIANPTMLHDGSGMGALVGAMAVLLAEDGFQGAPAITVEGLGAAPFWQDLGTRWTIEENYIKPYPICRWAHAALDAFSRIRREHEILPHEIASIEVRTFAEASALFPGMPTTTSQAQYSLRFALAALAIHGQLGPEQIQRDGLSNPQVAAMLGRIEVTEEPKHSNRFPMGRFSDVSVVLKDNRRLESGDVHATGGPEAPMTEEDLLAKYETLTKVLSPDRRSALWSMRTALLSPSRRFSDLLELVVREVSDHD